MFLYGCKSDLRGIEKDKMSLQNLIGANHINCDMQKWFFEKVTKNAKDEIKKMMIIFR